MPKEIKDFKAHDKEIVDITYQVNGQAISVLFTHKTTTTELLFPGKDEFKIFISKLEDIYKGFNTDYSSIFSLKGNEALKRAVEVALVGNFDVLFYGPELNFEFPYKYFQVCSCTKTWVKKCICDNEKLFEELKALKRKYPIAIELCNLSTDEIISKNKGETYQNVMVRVTKAKEILPEVQIGLDDTSQQLLKRAINTLEFADDEVKQIIVVAKAIAALDKQRKLKASHIAEAIQYKGVSK